MVSRYICFLEINLLIYWKKLKTSNGTMLALNIDNIKFWLRRERSQDKGVIVLLLH